MVWASSYYHYDALGSTRELTDSGQAVTDSYLYDAYGNEQAASGTTVNSFRYVGEFGYYLDADTAKLNVRARVYQPSIIRWLNQDPLRFLTDINLYVYSNNQPVGRIDPSGTKWWHANIVAKSFINGVAPVGSILPDRGGDILPLWLDAFFNLGSNVISTATQRLQAFAGIIGKNPGFFFAFFQNPVTDVKDGIYRLYTRTDISFCCDGNKLTNYNINATDMAGGLEIERVLLGYFFTTTGIHVPFYTPQLHGTIQRTPTKIQRVNDSTIAVIWMGWGRPNRLLEPGMQWVAQRTSTNIWHDVEVWLQCVNGRGTYTVPSFDGSRFPSHRLWINNGTPNVTRSQGFYSDLWTPNPVLGPSFAR